jgi:hypothetical protein
LHTDAFLYLSKFLHFNFSIALCQEQLQFSLISRCLWKHWRLIHLLVRDLAFPFFDHWFQGWRILTEDDDFPNGEEKSWKLHWTHRATDSQSTPEAEIATLFLTANNKQLIFKFLDSKRMLF